MSVLCPAETAVMRAVAAIMTPPPPPDVAAWAEANLVFDQSSPFPGPYDPARFPMLRRIHDCLGLDHPAREITVVGSAQIGKTEALIKPALAAWFDFDPVNTLVVHPTSTAANEWVRTKWLPFRRANPRMRAVFGADAGHLDSLSYQETRDRTASLRVVSSGSPSELSGTTRPRVVMDDLSKFETTDMGDPEVLATSRADAFDSAKILRVSTPMVAGACRITRAFQRGTAERWHVPCPHCGREQALAWENFVAVAAAPDRSHFTCIGCAREIEYRHRAEMMAAGRWVAANPGGDHPSFHLWRALMPFRDWASIAVMWAQAQGDPSSEHSFHNDVLGLAYEQASDAPEWGGLLERADRCDAPMPPGRVPAGRPILACGVDCQGDRIEWHLVAFGRENRAHTVDYGVVPHPIGTDEGRAGLDELLRRVWRNQAGRDVAIDRLAIDSGAYTDDVWDWARRHPPQRVVLVKGATSASGPIYQLQKFERRKDGRARRHQRRAYLVNVSALKATFYADLRKTDPEERGFQSFAAGLGDAFYRQLCAERRVLKRNRHGVLESRWVTAEPDRRNEALDTRLYAEVAARLVGARTLTDADWDRLEAERDTPPPGATRDLFDEALVPARPAQAAPAPASGIAQVIEGL